MLSLLSSGFHFIRNYGITVLVGVKIGGIELERDRDKYREIQEVRPCGNIHKKECIFLANHTISF